MQQFVLVPISVCNSNIKKPTAVTKKELPTYQSEEKPTYQIESVKKGKNKNLFAKSDSLVVKDLFSPRMKLSTSNFNPGWKGRWSFSDRLCSDIET